MVKTKEVQDMARALNKPEDDSALMKVIGNNLVKIKQTANWTQAKIAELTGYSAPVVGYYLKGTRMPGVSFLLKFCEAVRRENESISLNINDLVSDTFDPESAIKQIDDAEQELTAKREYTDMAGVYLCYYFDQARPPYDGTARNMRKLCCGVMVIFDEYNGMNTEPTMMVYASFYPQESMDEALAVKKDLESIVRSNAKLRDRNAKLQEYYERWQNGANVYSGRVSFSTRHAFVYITSPSLGDGALIALYRANNREAGYCGGLGSVASVAQGQRQMPAAQKIMISKYELPCDKTEIASHLGMEPSKLIPDTEATAVAEMCQKLYRSDDAITNSLDDGDKIAIITNRMKQLIQNYVQNHACCVGSVSEEDNDRACSLILRYKK